MYSKSLSLDVASRVWDVFFRDGEEFLFRTALGQSYNNIFFSNINTNYNSLIFIYYILV